MAPPIRGPRALLDKLLDAEGDESVVLAIESDPTLGGACDDLIVDTMDSYEVAAATDNTMRLVAAWSVRIFIGE